jgi:hypothetical protein
MCELAHGKPPSSEHEAAHSCGKGREGCVNPLHLRWATTSENHADKKLHGTFLFGSAVKNSKLSETQAVEIRKMRGTKSCTQLAKIFDVSPSTVNFIHTGKRWAHLSDNFQ